MINWSRQTWPINLWFCLTKSNRWRWDVHWVWATLKSENLLVFANLPLCHIRTYVCKKNEFYIPFHLLIYKQSCLNTFNIRKIGKSGSCHLLVLFVFDNLKFSEMVINNKFWQQQASNHLYNLWKQFWYSCNKITTTKIRISHQDWNGFFSDISHQMIN